MTKEYSRILIVEVNWLGDVLFSTPFIRAIRARFKASHIACMLPPRTREILENNPNIDEIIIYDEKGIHRGIVGKLALIKLVRDKKFDLAILLHRSLTRTLITMFAGVPERAGYDTCKRRRFLTLPIESPVRPTHKVEYFLGIAEFFGSEAFGKDYEFFIRERDREYVKTELARSGIGEDDRVLVINAGGNWAPKRWQEEKFAKLGDMLINKYGVKVVLSGSDKDVERAARISGMMSSKAISFAGKTNIKELGALMERAFVVISGDSGPMHIACAMKSKVIALFGPTSPDITGPYGPGHYKVLHKPNKCVVPCYDTSCTASRCMDSITVEDVMNAFEELIKL